MPNSRTTAAQVVQLCHNLSSTGQACQSIQKNAYAIKGGIFVHFLSKTALFLVIILSSPHEILQTT